MKSTFTATVLISGALLQSACSMTPPPRDPYSGPDTVGTIDQSMLVGRWQGRLLNPIDGESTGPAAIEFRNDNTLLYTVPDTGSGLGLVYDMSGTYTINGELITTRLTDIQETSGNSLGALAATFASAFRDRLEGTANVYEATADRIVLVSEQGQAQELRRVP